MKIPPKTDRLAFFRDLYQRSRDKQAPLYERLEKHRAQYKGSRAIDGSHVPASVVRNITYELIESQVSTLIPTPAAEAKQYTEQNDQCAKAIEHLCASLRRALPFEKLNDMDERYTYIYGGSVWFAEWDASLSKNGEEGGIRLSCLSPLDFVPEPGVYEVEDMEYCFIRLTATRGELSRRYGISDEELELADYDECDTDTGDTETASLIITFYKDADGDIGKFIFSGALTVFDMPKYYRRKVRVCKKCGESEESCRCAKKGFCRQGRDIRAHSRRYSSARRNKDSRPFPRNQGRSIDSRR